jgi:hypothetical protein
LMPRAHFWRDATGNQIAIGLEPTVGATTIEVWCTPDLPRPEDTKYVISTQCFTPNNRCQMTVDGDCP